MRYNVENKEMYIQPKNWNRNSPKEILQYAVGGLLYMPATNTKIADAIINRKHPDYTSICLCLEDAIGDDMVEQAERCVRDIMHRIYEAIKSNSLNINDVPLIFVRVREPQQIDRLYRVCDKGGFSLITGFNLPKFDKSNCDAYLDAFIRVQDKVDHIMYIMPIIESKNVMFKQRRIEQLMYLHDRLGMYSQHVLNIRVGATDFCSLFGIRRDINSTIYDMRVISDCLTDVVNVFARNYVCSGPVWEFFNSEGKPGAWSDGLKRELHLDHMNGFLGKTCIHPSQLKYIRESNIVSYNDYQNAIAILGMKDGIVGVQKSFGGNQMNEVKTHTTWAKKIVGLAEIYGVAAQEEK